MFADIIIDITHENLDKIFQYRIPEEMLDDLAPGMEVLVPFGRGNREVAGYVVGVSDTTDYDESKIKYISAIPKGKRAIESNLITLAAWMKDYYGGTMIQALKCVLPIRKEEKIKKKKILQLLLSEKEAEEKLALYEKKNQKARARLLSGLIKMPRQDYDLIAKKANVTLAVVKALEEQGVLKVLSEEELRNPLFLGKDKPGTKAFGTAGNRIRLNEEQQEAVDAFVKGDTAGERNTYLLYGVTGSGKTAVYLEMISHVVKSGRQAIVLIPEIALTYQTVLRFYQRFGERVSIIHSRLSAGEKSDQMERVKRGEVDVMIGPRSALFTPFSNLGLIVIDEEHEGTYKSEQIPRYHAREVAMKRGEIEGASVILGSATPSLESFHACENGKIKLLSLRERATRQTLPDIHVVDMRQELKAGNRSILSDRLRELLSDRLEKNQQSILFLNRRGMAGFVSCRSCGEVLKCPHCDVSLSSHRGGKLLCHYCGYEVREPKVCPSCGSPYIGGFKMGTEAIEGLIQKEFPKARVLRMDFDTTKNKGGHEKILEAFASHEADVLVGTQMIVKGHDFPDVTLVGILAADMSLYADDYRSAERTFELLVQAAGRAGRGSEKGQVVIQTYSPDHYAIETAAAQDYEAFYEEEMHYRDLMGYPPVAELMAVWLSCPDEEHLEAAASYLKKFALMASRNTAVTIIGPAAPSVGKVNDIYRRVLYLKGEEEAALTRLKDQMEQYIEMNQGYQTVKVQFDRNPVR